MGMKSNWECPAHLCCCSWLYHSICLYSRHYQVDRMVFFHFQVINLNTQLSYIVKAKKQLRQKLGDEATKKMLSEAVYLTSIGSNDYLSPLLSNSVFQSYSYKKQYIHMVIGNLTVVIKVIASFLLTTGCFILLLLWLAPIVFLCFRKYISKGEGNLVLLTRHH